MICPECGSINVTVNDTLPGEDNHIYRRRKCLDCGHRFRSVEQIIDRGGSYMHGFFLADRRRHPNRKKKQDT